MPKVKNYKKKKPFPDLAAVADALECVNVQPELGQGDLLRPVAGAVAVAVVPPRPAVKPIKRGTLGRIGEIAVNYLQVNMDRMPAVAYHYDVKFVPELPKKFYREAFEQHRVQYLGNAVAAFDGRASCYSVDKLHCRSQGEQVSVFDSYGRELKYLVEIMATAEPEVDLSSLRTYMRDRIYEKPMRALQCLEVVLAAPCHSKAIRSGRCFFQKSEPGKSQALGNGEEILLGLFQAFVLGDRPFVNVDITHKCFPLPMPIIEYLERYQLGQKITAQTNLESKRSEIDGYLSGVAIAYAPPASFASFTRVYKVNALTKLPASKQTFVADKGRLTVAEYFQSRGHSLRYPNLHCLHVGSPQKTIYLPIELCAIEGKQSVNRKDSTLQSAAMIKIAATSTNARRCKIMELLQYFSHNTDPTIARFGFRLQTDFVTVQTRTLSAPIIQYRNRATCMVRHGSWRNDCSHFYESKQKAHKWAIVHGGLNYNKMRDLEQLILAQSRSVNLSLAAKANIRAYRDIQSLDPHFKEYKSSQYDLVIVVVPNAGHFYDELKQKAELQYGILTQCIKRNTVERNCNPQVIGNLLLKINSKLNGINHTLKLDGCTELRNVMYLGADVTHPSPDQREIPSVVGVAGSHDPFGASYNMQYRLQRSALEEIEDMESITAAILRTYHHYRKCYPEHIMYYRDGVSDGQFPKIKNEELRGISVACAKLGIKPKICCIIVVKRHHTRFFPSGAPSQHNKYNNVEPGTVVDRTIVHPNEVQWFMVSHQSIQGTARPTRYNVIANTGSLDIDLLQQLTHNLCHMFPRCNRAVSYPAPAYLAHLAASRGRVYLTGTTTFAAPELEYKKRLISTSLTSKNPMYFI
ncbi:protein argonaute-2 [Drosophila obscura]|nr:protein argonaute-2 [Drosophila obscura]XP_022225408.1 protein argonaute-2 [Drosophila obscura]XP_022225410.1 protein argonaute-2 [Drosophila obscura]